ncbi:hypothetical protein DSCO28_57620 [Desulfosarcina ovata subsp. sediminis]|uniref:Uncharacterized protein n=1 Tax=Desulfosarcina ovata subsp. sediminis TaxID=885957 RepID=A0A5K7ZYH7_9BACT|nr:hypothetical protein [Desulfosarcina ovata]BBO85196.1 hypothetical protein DSCO28_57620 [Desulfosarcina ovata subsp. sediminis]
MAIVYTVISFLFGVMIGWVCLKLIRVIEKVTWKVAFFFLSILSGGGVLKIAEATHSMIMFHLFGLFVGWCLWIYMAKKHGAPPDVFYSGTGSHNNGEKVSSQSEKKNELFY